MSSRSKRLVQRRALTASVSAIALLSGLALLMSFGRAPSDGLVMVFVIAIALALLIALQAITVLAQGTMGNSYNAKGEREQDLQRSAKDEQTDQD